MDLDAFVSANKDTWARLNHLSKQSVLDAEQTRELIVLYRRTSTHLSMIRTGAPDAQLISELSAILLRARGRMAGKNRKIFRTIVSFFTVSYPAALYRFRAWWITAAILSVAFAFAVGGWVYTHPEVHQELGPTSSILQYVEEDFENYYTNDPDGDFTMLVWTNNWYAAAGSLAYGVTVIGAIQILIGNMANVAVAGALMTYHGRGGVFWGLILPHGLLELTAIFVAAGTGLALFWSLIQPGARTRLESFVHTGYRAVQVLFGLILTLFVSGFIEGYVTASIAPTYVQVGIGVLVWVLFLLYALVLGRKRREEADAIAIKMPERISVE
ncbi:MAG: stage II sporulation protein M [Actinomycetaceae bacterium]|nr:stage II sporulation protein M [Actinomycetaceae bacterium]